MAWQWVIWISILLIVWGGGYFFISKRLIGTTTMPDAWKLGARILLISMITLTLGTMFLIRYSEQLGSWWAWVTFVGMGFLSFVFVLLFARDMIWLGSLGVEKVYPVLQKLFSGKDAIAQVNPARREFLLHVSNLGVIGAAGILTAYGVYEARRRPGIVNISVPIAGLPKDFAGFKIVQITDIHAGLTVKRDWVETIAKEVADLKPDLIAFTGDLADGSVPHLRNDVAPLGELQAPHGKFFVTGNHEYYSGVEQWVDEARRLGYDVLLNEHRLVQRNGSALVVAGVTDPTGAQMMPQTHTPDSKAAIASAPQDSVKILLAHQPKEVFEAQPLGYHLMLSGHTHGGQFFPWNLVAALAQPYISGLHDHKGTWVYVSKGTGYWGPPVRLGARSEITVITLTEKDNA